MKTKIYQKQFSLSVMLIIAIQLMAITNLKSSSMITWDYDNSSGNHFGYCYTLGTCSDKKTSEWISSNPQYALDCSANLHVSSATNYILYDKATSQAWVMDGSKKTPIVIDISQFFLKSDAGKITLEQLNTFSKESGLSIQYSETK